VKSWRLRAYLLWSEEAQVEAEVEGDRWVKEKHTKKEKLINLRTD